MRELGIDIRNGLLILDKAKQVQRDMKNEINDLKNYVAKSDRTKNIKNKVLENVKIPYKVIKKVIKGFEDGDFEIKAFNKQDEQPSESNDEESEKDEKINLDRINGTEEELENLKDKVDKFSNQFKVYNDGLYIGKK